MSSIGLSNDVGKSKAVSIAVAPVVIVVFIFIISWIAQLGAAAQARIEYRRTAEMAGDNRALCEKWGMTAASRSQEQCVADIQSLSDRHHKRLMEDALPL
jgi:uncharacterized BrkB/YihY/UPF0761 family membrane protein